MFKFWSLILEPILHAIGARSIIEIGVDYGANTRHLLAYCLAQGGHLDYIDPAPSFDVEWAKKEYGGAGTFHGAISLEVLPKIDTPDAALIDGDHNWYTVYHELKAIADKAQASGKPFPLVLFHDVTWPYGRRDLYYSPERVPLEHRQPYARKGIEFGTSELLPTGGLNAQLCNAIREGGPRNGVLTGAEDFVAESKVGTLTVIPILYGLGILVPERLAKHEGLQRELKKWESPEGLRTLLELVERDRVEFHAYVHTETARTEAARKDREGHIRHRENQLGDATSALLDERAERARLSAELTRMAAENDRLRRELDLIHSSHTWRLTKVVRSASAMVGLNGWSSTEKRPVIGGSPELSTLHEQNRQAPDVDVERKLVQLRTTLFERRERKVMSSGLGERRVSQHAGYGLPVVPRGELDAERVRSALSSQGALHVRDLLDPAQIHQMRVAIDAALEAQELARARKHIDSPWYHESPAVNGGHIARDFVHDTGSALAVDSPRGLYQLLDLYYRLGIDELITGYFGERPALSAEKTTLRRCAPGPEELGWHQDGRFLGANIRSLNVWIALTDCPVDAPGLEVLPTRLEHIVPTGTEGAKYDWCVSPKLVAEKFPGACIRPVFKAGDALLFDHFLLHRTFRKPTMTRHRYAIESWFFAPSAYPEAQTGLYV
jgi:hypothetical protein